MLSASTGLIVLSGCQGTNGVPQSKEKLKGSSTDSPRDRYELHDVQDGKYRGTLLLDKQTGRIWQPITLYNGETLGGFQEVEVTPLPSGASGKTKPQAIPTKSYPSGFHPD